MHIVSALKKLCCCIASAALACSLVPAAALAASSSASYSTGDTFTSDGIAYTVTSDTTVSVGAQSSAGTAFAADSGDVAIPAAVEGYAVTAIASYAFSNGSDTAAAITSVSVPASVQSVGEYAFYGCSSLETLTFAQGAQIATISKYAFCGCGITELELPNSVTTLGMYAFALCSQLQTLTFEDVDATEPALTCGEGTFSSRGDDSSSLLSVELPARLSYVADSMFENHTALQRLEFAGTSTGYIGNQAFSSCESLTYIEIPELTDDNKLADSTFGVTSAFACVPSLKTIVFTGDEDYSPSDSSFYATKIQASNTAGHTYTYPDVETVVYYGTHTSTIFEDANHYYAVYFHDSAEDAAAEEEATGYACVRGDVAIKDITTALAAQDGAGTIIYDGAIKSAGSGMSWYFGGSSVNEPLEETTHVYAVASNDLTYAQLELEQESAYYSGSAAQVQAQLYAVDGTLLALGTHYMLSAQDEDGNAVDVDSLVQTGTYTIVATATAAGGYTGSCSAEFFIQQASCTWTRMSGNAKYSTTNHIAEAAFEEGDVSTVILVGEGHEVEGAAAMGLAGCRDATVLVTDPDSLTTEAIYTLNHYEPESVILIGMTDPSSYAFAVEDKLSFEVSVSTSFDAATAAATVDNYYSKTASLGYWDDADTAIVASDADAALLAVIGAYAYATCSPVFLAEDGATLSETALAALGSGAFSQVILLDAGGSLSSSVTVAVSSCGISTIVELGESDAYTTSTAIAEWLVDEQGFSCDGLAVASADDLASVVAGAAVCGENAAPLLLAEDEGEAAEGLLAYLQANIYSIHTAYLLGVRAYLSEAFFEDVQAVWSTGDSTDLLLASVTLSEDSLAYTGEAQVPTVTVTACDGTVLEEGTDYSLGYYNSATDKKVSASQVSSAGEYTVTATGAGSYSNARSAAFSIVEEAADDGASASGSSSSTTTAPKVGSTFKVGKVTYKLTSKGAVAVKKVAASAKGKLTIPAKVRGYSVTSVSAKAFKGCRKLTAVTLASKKLKSIGASAFAGCSKLKTLTVKSTALTGIGSKALYGCKALRTLTLKTKKLAKVGSKALKGVTKRATVKVPSAKVAKYRKLLRKAGLPKAAKVKKG